MILDLAIFKSAELFSLFEDNDDILKRGYKLTLSLVNEILAGQECKIKEICISSINKFYYGDFFVKNSKFHHSSLSFIYSCNKDIQQHLEYALPEIDKLILKKVSEEIIKLVTSENAFLSTKELFYNKKEVDMELITCICLGVLFLAIAWIFISNIKSEDAQQALEILKEYYKKEKISKLAWIEKIIKSIPFLIPKTKWTWETAWKDTNLTEEEKCNAIKYLTDKHSNFSEYLPEKNEKFNQYKMLQINNENLPYVVVTRRGGLQHNGQFLEKAIVICGTSDYLAIDALDSRVKELFITEYPSEFKSRNVVLTPRHMSMLQFKSEYKEMDNFLKNLIEKSLEKDLDGIAKVGLKYNTHKMHPIELEQSNAFVSAVEHIGLIRRGEVLLKAKVHIEIREY